MTLSPPNIPSSSSSFNPPGSYQNTAAGQQRPTLTNIHIRSVDDAKKLFYAVQLGMLPKVERRLDAQERRMLKPGNVYVWEEKGPTGGESAYQVCIERWTEGLSWSASRIRDDFLMYYENVKKKSLENEVLREGERDLYVKQTYSVHRNDVLPEGGLGSAGDDAKEGPRKWHLNAYFTKSTEGNLNTIDSIPFLRDLVVPEGLFSSARQAKKSKRGREGSSVQRTYAPFPVGERGLRPAPPPPLPPPVSAPQPQSHSNSPLVSGHPGMRAQQQPPPPPTP
ncbi:Gti1/Pac2 family-domain-containing protein, partial [Cytidiella melzeri]